jgi:cyanophycin synthetase
LAPGDDSATFATVLTTVARAGRPGRELAVGLDLVRSMGVRQAWRRGHEHLRRRQVGLHRRHGSVEGIWTDAARELGAEVRELPGGFLEIRQGAGLTRIWKHWVMLDDIVSARLALEKALGHRLLSEAGLPVPDHLEFDARDLAGARGFLQATGGPCVVKPVGAAGGSGITPGVRSVTQLRRAVLRAGRRSSRLLIEPQVPGDVYRLLLLDGELLDAIRRFPPTVTGDGNANIGQLIAAENARRRTAPGGPRWHLTVDLDCLFTLEHAGLSLSSVPAAGQRVVVKTAVNQNGAGDNSNARDEISPMLADEAARAARALGVRLAGIDIITTDPTRSLAGRGVILEVNATPGIHYHYAIDDPSRVVAVAVPILRRLLDEARPTSY